MKHLLPCISGFSDQAIGARLGSKEEGSDGDKMSPIEKLEPWLQKTKAPHV